MVLFVLFLFSWLFGSFSTRMNDESYLQNPGIVSLKFPKKKLKAFWKSPHYKLNENDENFLHTLFQKSIICPTTTKKIGWLTFYKLGWGEFYKHQKFKIGLVEIWFLDKNWTFNIVCLRKAIVSFSRRGSGCKSFDYSSFLLQWIRMWLEAKPQMHKNKLN